MQRLDRRKRLHFIDASIDGITCPIDRAQLLSRFHACEDGVMLDGAAAFAAMWRAIPVLRPIGLLARHRLMLALLDCLYKYFLSCRPAIQKRLA